MTISFISGTLQTSKQFQFTTRKYTDLSEKDRMNTTSEPITVIKFKETYILIGLGAIISLFLLIIIIQLCKKSKSSKKKKITGYTCDDSVLHVEPSFQSNRGTYNAVYEGIKTNQSYQSLSVEYIEINEQLETREPNNLSADGRPVTLTRNVPLLRHSTNEVFVEQMTEESLLTSDTSDPYLIPVYSVK